MRPPEDEEIWEAVRNLPKDSAAGNDGFTGAFFQACWNTIGEDVSEGIKFYFRGFHIPNAIAFFLKLDGASAFINRMAQTAWTVANTEKRRA